MRDVISELKALRLHGMAATWAELGEQSNGELERSRWLVEHMLKAEASDRATRSVTGLPTAVSCSCSRIRPPTPPRVSSNSRSSRSRYPSPARWNCISAPS
jgi:hypothetical protein